MQIRYNLFKCIFCSEQSTIEIRLYRYVETYEIHIFIHIENVGRFKIQAE